MVKSTGEVFEFDDTSPEKIMESWKLIGEYLKAFEQAKDKLKKLVPNIVDARGIYEHEGFAFRVYATQRMNYDKSILRNVLDADTYDLLLKPDKTAIDNYLKDNLEYLKEKSTELRTSMVAEGKPYQTVRLEKL